MWTAISSYIWGESDEQVVPGCSVDDTQSDNDWILVELRESKLSSETQGNPYCLCGENIPILQGKSVSLL